MIPRRWFHRKQSCIINTDLQRWMQCNFYWTERPSGRQNSVKIKIETFISNVFERKVKSCNTSQYLHVGKKFRKEAKVQVQQTVCWSARTKWESFVEYKNTIWRTNTFYNSVIMHLWSWWLLNLCICESQNLLLQTDHNDKNLIFIQTDENFLRTERFSSFRERTLAILSK